MVAVALLHNLEEEEEDGGLKHPRVCGLGFSEPRAGDGCLSSGLSGSTAALKLTYRVPCHLPPCFSRLWFERNLFYVVVSERRWLSPSTICKFYSGRVIID